MSSIYVVVTRDAEKRELLVIPFGKDKSIYHIRPDGSRGKISLHSSGYHHQKTFNYKAKEYRYIEESKGKQKSPLKTDHFRPLTIYHWNIGASFDNFKTFRKNSNKNNIVSVNENRTRSPSTFLYRHPSSASTSQPASSKN